MSALGKQIRELRKKAGLGQNELAELLNTTQARISRIESGKDRLFTKDQLKPFSDALKVPLATLEKCQNYDADIFNGDKVLQEIAESSKKFGDKEPADIYDANAIKIFDGEKYLRIPNHKLSVMALPMYLGLPRDQQEQIELDIVKMDRQNSLAMVTPIPLNDRELPEKSKTRRRSKK